ncbi:uncharacterized protein FIBRA_07461 [Fibroporia radiculosa]|uniref:Alpha/beta hydrolase fold-3 domain-containing protein n=1 Tax=Fibroporia radiculosa TaxID=599839 RepID=J4IBU1_9APHY|nr:uncharacterized protein FIBRA_07461 [Fibroporia radiculosa]CCM05251.1 predicted protein [Fibroporia radiculosa]
MIAAAFQTSLNFGRVDPEKLVETGKNIQVVWIEPTPELIVGEIKEAARVNNVEPARVAGVWYGQRGSNAQAAHEKAGPEEKVMYELHGGGWVLGNASPKWDSAYLCERMIQYADEYSSVLQIEYRLSDGPPFPPKGAFPAALIDAIAGYDYLVNVVGFKPWNIVVVGDSTGGNLAFALVRYLAINQFSSLPLPRAQFLLSPTADWGRTHEGPNSAMERNSETDFLHWFLGGYATRALLGSLPESDAYSNSWISPGGLRMPHVKGMFAGMPPTLIMSGELEMTLDGITTFRDRIATDNAPGTVTYIELPDTTHAAMTGKWHEPQATRGIEEFAKWLNQVHDRI